MTEQTGPESAEPRAGNLTGPARQVHQAALAGFARTGEPPARSELERLPRTLGPSPDAVLAELAEADAIVFNDHGEIRAAYPFSPVHTPIRVSWPPAPPLTHVCDRRARHVRHARGNTATITAAEPDTGRVITVSCSTAAARTGRPQSSSRVRRPPQVIPAVPQWTAPADTSTSSPAAGPRVPGRSRHPEVTGATAHPGGRARHRHRPVRQPAAGRTTSRRFRSGDGRPEGQIIKTWLSVRENRAGDLTSWCYGTAILPLIRLGRPIRGPGAACRPPAARRRPGQSSATAPSREDAVAIDGRRDTHG